MFLYKKIFPVIRKDLNNKYSSEEWRRSVLTKNFRPISFTMNFSIVLVLFLAYQGCAFYLQNNFPLKSINNFDIKPSRDDESVVLRKILINYIVKYFSEDQIYISIVVGTSTKERIYFHDDFFYNLFHDPKMENFTYNVLDGLDDTVRDKRSAFCLILTADTKSLE